jgi:uncharacterized protein (TIGR02271 family)
MTMNWLGAEVVDHDGSRYARLDEIFVGRTSGRPEFGIVSLLDGSAADSGRVAVPLTQARDGADAGTVQLGVDRERVLSAPRMQGDTDEIPAAAGKLILEHFGVADAEAVAAQGTSPMPRAGAAAGDADDAPAEVVRHEEQLSVDTRAQATERVRVRKRVVTEEVTLTVTVRREELVIDREPIPDGAPGISGPSEFPLAEDGGEVEFVLHAEEPVVTKRVVPVERVSLRRETTTEARHVTDSVRKERVEIDELPINREDTTT